jgi:hypothetical protein
MAQHIASCVKIYADKYDITPFANRVLLGKGSDIHVVTPFCATSERVAPGLQAGTFQIQGFTEFGPSKIEAIMDELKGTQDKALTVVPEGALVPNVAVFMKAAFHGFDYGGPHGNPNTFNWTGATSAWQVISGFLEEPGLVARIATGNSTGQNLGLVATGKFLYGIVHVTAASGTATLDLIVESDDSGTFTTPTTRLTFPQFTTSPGAAIIRTAGPIAVDTHFRFKWTIAGGTPSYTFAAALAIAS